MLFSFDCLYFVTIITLFKVTPSEDDFFRYYFCLFELFAFANQMHNYPRLFLFCFVFYGRGPLRLPRASEVLPPLWSPHLEWWQSGRQQR